MPFKFYKYNGLKRCYFSYKYQFDTGINQSKNYLFLPYFFSTDSLFTFIRNKTEILKKFIEVVVYMF
jgi:hypothetical protein